MLAAILAGSAVVVALAALKYDHDCQAKRLTVVMAELRGIGARLETLENSNFKLWLRADRLQNMVQERGWRDSLMLTKFDWKLPEKF